MHEPGDRPPLLPYVAQRGGERLPVAGVDLDVAGGGARRLQRGQRRPYLARGQDLPGPRRDPGGDVAASPVERSASSRVSAGSSVADASPAGSAAGAVLPSRTIRGRWVRASSSSAAAVTPRAPPVATTTDSELRRARSPGTNDTGTNRGVVRLPSARSPTSDSGPP